MTQKQLQTLLKKPATWLAEGGEENELVLSTRVRLARNIEGRTFTHCADASELEAVRAEAKDRTGLLVGRLTGETIDDRVARSAQSRATVCPTVSPLFFRRARNRARRRALQRWRLALRLVYPTSTTHAGPIALDFSISKSVT